MIAFNFVTVMLMVVGSWATVIAGTLCSSKKPNPQAKKPGCRPGTPPTTPLNKSKEVVHSKEPEEKKEEKNEDKKEEKNEKTEPKVEENEEKEPEKEEKKEEEKEKPKKKKKKKAKKEKKSSETKSESKEKANSPSTEESKPLTPTAHDYNEKEKAIADGQKKAQTDYPTFEDVESDWDEKIKDKDPSKGRAKSKRT